MDDSGDQWSAFLRRHIARLGWNVSRLATEANLNRSSVSDWVNNRRRAGRPWPTNITIASVFAIADAVGVERGEALKAAAGVGADSDDAEVELIRSSDRTDAVKERMIKMLIQRREEERIRRMADLEFMLSQDGDAAAT